VKAAGHVQSFFGITADGRAAAMRSRGNPDCHVVLRGGSGSPNFSSEHLSLVESELLRLGLRPSIMVDCSHDNSLHRPELQPQVLAEVVRQVLGGRRSIIGFMVESNLAGGSQPMALPDRKLRYGVSITDACLDWASTERCLREAHAELAPRFDSLDEWSPAGAPEDAGAPLSAAGA
jgi:3-deoxy-7-phosphoheptulonate synthase